MDKKKMMEKRWFEILKEEFQKPYMKNLQKFLKEEKEKGYEIYPEEHLIFNAFCTPLFDEIKVVIVGQDPYHGPGQAHGFSFSVRKGIPQPPSLKNIFKELVSDVGIKMPKTGCLESWAKQGVFLLNATLTVRKSMPKSHFGEGWEKFTDIALEKLVRRKDPIVFLLWGNSAKEKCDRVFDKTPNNHLILKASHPSFYSVHNFFGCKHFSKTNDFFKKNKKKEIDWQIE